MRLQGEQITYLWRSLAQKAKRRRRRALFPADLRNGLTDLADTVAGYVIGRSVVCLEDDVFQRTSSEPLKRARLWRGHHQAVCARKEQPEASIDHSTSAVYRFCHSPSSLRVCLHPQTFDTTFSDLFSNHQKNLTLYTMSYNNQGGYGQSYPQQPQYGGGYGGGSNYNDPNAYPQQPQYGQQGGYGQQQQGGYGSQNFGGIQRQDSYGPPQTGGFQHGQQGGQYGAYDASNPQGHAGYYGGYPEANRQQSYGGQSQYGQNDSYAANQAYQQNMGTSQGPDPALANQIAPQSSDPNAPNYDPNVSTFHNLSPLPYSNRYQAPPMTESDRGLLGALGGGFAGHHFGKKQDHGFLGTVGGAILGSFAEDFMKKKKNESKYSNSGSSWGGGSKW